MIHKQLNMLKIF